MKLSNAKKLREWARLATKLEAEQAEELQRLASFAYKQLRLKDRMEYTDWILAVPEQVEQAKILIF